MCVKKMSDDVSKAPNNVFDSVAKFEEIFANTRKTPAEECSSQGKPMWFFYIAWLIVFLIMTLFILCIFIITIPHDYEIDRVQFHQIKYLQFYSLSLQVYGIVFLISSFRKIVKHKTGSASLRWQMYADAIKTKWEKSYPDKNLIRTVKLSIRDKDNLKKFAYFAVLPFQVITTAASFIFEIMPNFILAYLILYVILYVLYFFRVFTPLLQYNEILYYLELPSEPAGLSDFYRA